MFQDAQTAKTGAPGKEFFRSLFSLFKEQADLLLVHCLHMLWLAIAARIYISLGQ